MVTRTRALILLGMTVAVFVAALAAGRALRPAGAPAAAGTRTILVGSTTIVAPMKHSEPDLPPLADPRPRPDEPPPEDAPPEADSGGDAPDPDTATPPDVTTPPPVTPPPAQPTTPAPPPQQPADPPDAAPKEQDDSGGWSSGN